MTNAFSRFDSLRRAVLDEKAPPRHVRRWVQGCLDRQSEIHSAYRAFGWDIDGDLEKLSARFQPTPEGFMRMECEYFLRRVWRFLLGNHAVGEARRVGARLKRVSKDHWGWRFWRGVSYFYPRLLVGVAVGYLALLGAGDLVTLLKAGPEKGWGTHTLMLGIFLVAALVLSMADVQRHVGRRRAFIRRSLRLWMYGLGYACVGFLVHIAARWWFCVPFQWGYPSLLAAAALFVGFVVQLFGLDISAGEPI
jgi:hypothetical protein